MALSALCWLAVTLPATADAAMDEGLKLFNARNYTQAFYSFERAKNNQANTADCMYYQAMCYFGMGQTGYGRTMLRTTVSQFPASAAGTKAREVLLRLGDIGEAAKPVLSGSANVKDLSLYNQPFVNSFSRDRHGRMVVNVRVNSKTLLPMMLDTGADVCTLSAQQAAQAGIDTSKPVAITTIYGASGESKAKAYRAHLQVGNVEKEVDVYVMEASNDSPLLGRNFFADLALEVDDAKRILRFCDRKDLKISTGAAAIPYRTNGHGLFVTAKINGRECEMVFDTGCATTSFTDKQWSGLGMSMPIQSSKGQTLGIGGQREAKMFNVPTIELGGIIKYDVPAAVSIYGAQDKPLLGMSFLQGLKYVLNPFDQHIYLSK